MFRIRGKWDCYITKCSKENQAFHAFNNSGKRKSYISRSSTCPLTSFFWLLSHVIYLQLTRVLYECLLSQAEWWVAEILYLSLNNWALNFLQKIALNLLRFTSHQKNWEKCKLFNVANFWMIKLTKTSILPNCQVPNSFFWYNCKFYHSKTALGKKTLL